MPATVRPNRTLGKHERLILNGGAFMMLADNPVDYSASVVIPLNACRTLAGAAEPKPLFGGTALSRYLNERRIDDDALFRKRDGAIAQNNSDQTRACFAFPTGAKDG
jgi:hypothetical protein